MNMNKKIVIVTPEGVEFSFRLAGPIIRCMALCIDLGAVYVVTFLLGMAIRIFSLVSPEFSAAINIVAYFLIGISYSIFLEWLWNGQTLGKRCVGIRVIDGEGLRLRFSQILTRNLLRAFDVFPAFYFLGGLVSILSPARKRLGDIAAGTIVVRENRMAIPDIERIVPEKFNSLRSSPEIVGALRSKTPPELSILAFEAIIRKDSLDKNAQVQIYAEIVDCLKNIVRLDTEVFEHIPDEVLVRDFLDIMFRKTNPSCAVTRG